MDINAGDLLASLDYGDYSDIDALINNSEGVDNTAFDMSQSMMEDLDLETFTDLSDLLLEETFEGLDETPVVDTVLGQPPFPLMTTESLPPPQPICPVPIPATPRHERMVISDHDYVSKKSRVKMSTVVEITDIAETSQASEVIVDADFSDLEEDQPSPRPPAASYTERRRKNNIASRRSREIKKRKFVDMDDEADRLEIDNKRLAEKIVEFEQLAKEMKALLVQKVAGRIATCST